MNNKLEKEKILALVKEFREIYHDPDHRPFLERNDYGAYRVEGTLRFEHYVLYALIRGKDPLKCVKRATDLLKIEHKFKVSSWNWYQKVFKSLTQDEFNEMVEQYQSLIRKIQSGV